MVERWQKTYKDKIKVYDAFSKYEDEGNKVLKKLLKKYSFENKSVLEVGCGSGKYTKLLAPKSKKYYALEISKPLIELTKKRCKKIKKIKYFNCSAEEIPLTDNSVDVVFASWVLTAMISEKMITKSAKELLRVLKKGGDVWLLENHWKGEFMDMRGPEKIRLEKSNINKLIKKYGFEVVEIVNTNFSFPNLDEAKRIMSFIFGNNALKYLRKKPNIRLKHKIAILHLKKR